MEDKRSLGEYIAEHRRALGLTQRQFAERLYVTDSAVSKWERGLSYPDITLLHDICAVLGVTEHELLTASEDTEARRAGALAPERLGGVCTLGAFTLALELLLGVCCAYVGGDWFFVAGMSVLFGLGLLFLPYVLKRLPLPENVKTRRAALSLGLDLALLLGLLAVCCTHVDGDWFWITAVSVVFACSVLILPFVIRQLPLPGRLAEHRAALWLGVCSLLLFVLLGAARLYGGGDWFLLPGLPMALYGLALPWGLLLALRYLRAGGLYRAAAAAGFAALWYWLFPWVLDRVMALDGLEAEPPYSLLRPFGFELGDWSPASTASNVMFLILLALVLTALTLLLCALFRDRRKNRPAPPREPQD